MSVQFQNTILLADCNGKVLTSLYGDVLQLNADNFITDLTNFDINFLHQVLSQRIIEPIVRIAVLYDDESVNYIIPESDIINKGISYNEGYQNGVRRTISLKLVNKSVQEFRNNVINTVYPYMPSASKLWYGTKIGYDIGFRYQGSDYLFRRGIYVITDFDLNNSVSSKEVSYQLKDKFEIFSGNTGVLETGYEIPVGTPIDLCVDDLLNLSCSDGDHYDLKPCIIDSKYSGFVTQSTIRIDEGGHLSDIFDQLATQMSAEYYYNSTGNLVFTPIDASMNDVDKPILWSYDDGQLSTLELKYTDDIINVVSVNGTNVDGGIYSGTAKNDNLSSPINVYMIKERRKATITNANVWTDDMAKELAEYHLREATLYQLKQSITVPFNPLLMVNNLIELTNENLNMERDRWLITGISYSVGDESMRLDLTALNYLPYTFRGK